jgi:hypothetical protein
MTCKPCESGKGGTYNLKCTKCCARLVRNSRPSRERQEAIFEVISRTPESPSRDAILEELKKLT